MATKTVVVRSAARAAPRAQTIRIAMPSNIKARARRTGRRVGGAVLGEKNALVPIIAAYLLGMAKKNGTALPTIMGMGPSASVGLIAWGIGKYTKSPLASHAATGLLSVAAYSYAREGVVAGVAGDHRSGGRGRAVVFDDDDDDLEGEDYDGDDDDDGED